MIVEGDFERDRRSWVGLGLGGKDRCSSLWQRRDRSLGRGPVSPPRLGVWRLGGRRRRGCGMGDVVLGAVCGVEGIVRGHRLLSIA